MNKMGSLTKKRLLRKRVKQITEGLFSATTDLLLFSLYLPAASLGTTRSRAGVEQTFEEAYQMLEEINYKTIKRALSQLKKQGLIESLTRGFTEIQITTAGRKKLESLLPLYDEKRSWDGRLYLVNYDVKIKNNRQRDLLRQILIKTGAILLQKSLYLCCYNPYEILQDFLKKEGLAGTILVSELGKRGFLGKGDLKEFIWKAANLEEVNNRYLEFITKYKNGGSFPKSQIALDFYSILRNDPQLPFELLGEKYLGDKAYLLFLKFTS